MCKRLLPLNFCVKKLDNTLKICYNNNGSKIKTLLTLVRDDNKHRLTMEKIIWHLI